VVHFGQDRPASVRQAIDDPEFPERPVTLEPFAHEQGDQFAECGLVVWLGERHPAEVRGGVERRVVHPGRWTEVERHGADLLVVAGNPGQPGSHGGDELVLARGRSLGDRDRGDGEGRAGVFVLDREEGRTSRPMPPAEPIVVG
jgi:hypothetical protein